MNAGRSQDEQPRRLTQAERRAATRASLLTAAGGVFAQRGFHGATLDQIADRAGLTKGAVYYNFASKEELFLALLEERLGERLADAERQLEPQRSAGAQVRAAAAGFLGGFERDPRWAPLLFEFIAYTARDPALRKDFAEHFLGRARAALARVISAHFAELGTEPPLPPEQLAVAVSALANGMAIERAFDPAAAPPELLGEAIALLVGAGGRGGGSSP